MSTTQDYDIKLLNDLIAMTLDSARAYETASQASSSQADRHRFEDQAIARRRIRMMLQDALRMLGAEPAETGSPRQSAQRAMAGVKDSVGGSNGARLTLVEMTEDRLTTRLEGAIDDSEISPIGRAASLRALESVRGMPRAPSSVSVTDGHPLF